jgi:hypothetical protein
MGILCAILSLPISILLVRWLMKKRIDDLFLLLLLASALLLVGLTVFMIIKINKWAKLKPVQELRSEGRAAD